MPRAHPALREPGEINIYVLLNFEHLIHTPHLGGQAEPGGKVRVPRLVLDRAGRGRGRPLLLLHHLHHLLLLLLPLQEGHLGNQDHRLHG